MSLIIDALKKAQQLRLKESKGIPSPTYSPESKKSLRSLWKRWILIGIVLASLVISPLIYWNFVSPPSPSISIRTAARIEKKIPIPIEEKKTQEPSKDRMSLPKEVQDLSKEVWSLSKDILSLPKEVLALSKDQPSYPLVEKVWAGGGPSVEKKKEEPLLKQMPGKKETAKVSPPLPPPPQPIRKGSLPSLKEPVSTKSVEVKEEGSKPYALTSEILTHFNLGVQFHNQREFLKAIQAYQRVIELDPNYVEAYNNLGIIYQETGDLDRAFEAYQKSIEINPQYEKGHNNLGVLLYLKGRNEEAFEAFQKALAINPNNIESHINLGILFKKQGQLDKAIESYQKALDINPLLREIHYNIALLYEQLGNVKLAIGHYQQFIKLSSASHSNLVSKVQEHLDELIMEIKKGSGGK